MEVLFESQIIRDFTLGLTAIFIGFMIQFAALFFYEWLKEGDNNLKDSRFLWSIFLIFLVIHHFAFLVADFYQEIPDRQFWLDIGYISVFLGVSTFILIQEEALNLRTKGLLAISNTVALVILVALPREFQVIIVVPLVIVYTALFLFFIRAIMRISSPVDKAYFSLFILGVVLYIAGGIATSDISISVFGSKGYVIGIFFTLIGGYIANLALYSLPSFNDIGWERTIKEIYVLYASGIPLLHVKVIDGEFIATEAQDEIVLAAGVLSALKSALKIITRSKKETAMVDQGDIKIIFGVKDKITIVVLAERDSPMIHRKANEFLAMFTNIYKDEIIEWKGDLSVFKPAYNLLRTIFFSKKQEKT
ncbi:MAG: hypothetical protein ACP6IS_07605 [Candidatus Asgardarchaeia archaeon]